METALSDFHRMILIVMKTSYQKRSPKIKKYRDYRYFSNGRYRESLLQGYSSNDIPFESFLTICNDILDKEAPREKVCQRKTFAFMNKTIVESNYVEN